MPKNLLLMIDLCFLNSAKMAVVFILMLLSATLEAKQNDKFYNLMTAIGEHFGGEFNDAEKVLELDLNGANSFLDELHTFATREILQYTKTTNTKVNTEKEKLLNSLERITKF
uniref:Uncharacterized protein n=1 Tax=Globodera rostochiensis TaxID=31243 RepID=A0A914HXW1_GLORO